MPLTTEKRRGGPLAAGKKGKGISIVSSPFVLLTAQVRTGQNRTEGKHQGW